jgi:hypothetical protein
MNTVVPAFLVPLIIMYQRDDRVRDRSSGWRRGAIHRPGMGIPSTSRSAHGCRGWRLTIMLLRVRPTRATATTHVVLSTYS